MNITKKIYLNEMRVPKSANTGPYASRWNGKNTRTGISVSYRNLINDTGLTPKDLKELVKAYGEASKDVKQLSGCNFAPEHLQTYSSLHRSEVKAFELVCREMVVKVCLKYNVPDERLQNAAFLDFIKSSIATNFPNAAAAAKAQVKSYVGAGLGAVGGFLVGLLVYLLSDNEIQRIVSCCLAAFATVVGGFFGCQISGGSRSQAKHKERLKLGYEMLAAVLDARDSGKPAKQG
jgi:hypothetical protein